MIALSNVSKSFGLVEALAGIDLTIPAGSTTALIGPSGCGKSTLLRVMNGLVIPDSGTVQWAGETLGSRSLAQIRQRQGYVIQDGGLFPHLSVSDNASLLVRYLRWDVDRIAERMKWLMGLTQLPDDALNRYPRQLSGGQRQRVSLMRALMPDPDVLLLDEPLGSLDPMIRSELQSDLRIIFEQLGKTVILVTHDLAEASYFSNSIVLMREGRIVQTGPMAELVASPAEPFVSRFIDAQRGLSITP